jgi:hypothetical protein
MNNEHALSEACCDLQLRLNKIMDEQRIGLRDALIWLAQNQPEIFTDEAPKVLDRLLRSKIFGP